jgi:hypothetical protein
MPSLSPEQIIIVYLFFYLFIYLFIYFIWLFDFMLVSPALYAHFFLLCNSHVFFPLHG